MHSMKLTAVAMAVATLALGATMAAAGDRENICGYYGKVGGSVVSYMLPLTLQEVVDMMAGRNPDLLAAMTDRILNAVTAGELASVSGMADGASDLLGDAAGDQAFKMLMSGQVGDAREVESKLSGACMTVGPATIIANQRAAAAASARNMPK